MGIGHRAYDATVGRLFAAFYDRLMADTEEAGLSDRRSDARRGRGRTVELGAGTGLNLAHYPDGVEELILTEPFAPMAERLRERGGDAGDGGRGAGRRAADPDDASIDTASRRWSSAPSTTCRRRWPRSSGCSSPAAACCSRARPLGRSRHRPAGRTGCERPWQFFGHGCHRNRDTLAAIERLAARDRHGRARASCRRRRRSSGRWSSDGAASPPDAAAPGGLQRRPRNCERNGMRRDTRPRHRRRGPCPISSC